ncbi:MAG: hypothetical protein Q9172_005279 [Xanthocarpia lactea]
MRVLDRLKWAVKEKNIIKLLTRLQTSKASLGLMLTILTCTSIESAETTTRDLTSLVQAVLKSNTNMSRRMRNIERMHPAMNPSACPSLTASMHEDDLRQLSFTQQSSEISFEKELEKSPAYKRTPFNRLRALSSSSNGTSGPSFLSGLSLAEVSNVTSVALPISRTELWNHHRYTSMLPSNSTAESSALDEWYYPAAKAKFTGHLIYRRFSIAGPDVLPKFKEGLAISSSNRFNHLFSNRQEPKYGERVELEDTSCLVVGKGDMAQKRYQHHIVFAARRDHDSSSAWGQGVLGRSIEGRQAASIVTQHSKKFTMTPSTNNEAPSLLEDNMNQLSLGSSAAPSTHGKPTSPSSTKALNHHASPSVTPKPPPKPLQRTPSSNSTSISEHTATPFLNRKSSYSSTQGASTGATPPRSPALRRVSSNVSLNQPTMGPRSALPTPAEEPEKPTFTAASVARDYFGQELEVHQEGSGADHSHHTVVILQDDCYGHRFSRPRTSRASLGTIVERPERIHASILGLATAYVRAGGRHCEGHAAPHPKKKIGLLASMPFRIHKTDRRVSLTSQAAASVHGAQWMSELRTMCDAAESKLAATGKELARPQPTQQSSERDDPERNKLHEGDLYLCAGSLEALEGAIGGVCEAVDAVFKDSGPKRAFVCIRPPGHHCSAGMPSGFCWVNNVHIGINYATRTHDLTHAAIIDFDLHHGDGSQSIAWAHNAKVASSPKNTPQSKRTAIGYFSLHDINSYPCEMGDEDKVRNASLCMENAHGQTIWNVHLQPWKTEKEFWELYQDRYTAILSKARSFLRHHTERIQQAPLHPRPKAAIFISAGFDASEWESPGMQRHQVNVPTDFYARFTRDVVAIADEEGLGVDGRVISVLEGGYSDRALMSGVLSHLSGLTVVETPSSRPTTSNGLGHEMSQRLGKLEINGQARHGSGNVHQHPNEPLDPDWWALPRLEELERLVNPPAPAGAPKKVRSAVPPTYSSATQSYMSKVVSPPQNRRSLSGAVNSYINSMPSSPRAPTPPPPPVDWATAAHELSKLLVPSTRQTLSCKPEDLNAEATRARRDRQSNIGLPMELPANDGKRMQLRDRKAKTPKYASDEEEERPKSRASRRKTIADVTTLPQDGVALPPLSAAADPKRMVKPKGRRSSMASSAGSINGDKTSSLAFDSSSIVPLVQDSVTVKKSRVPSSSRIEAVKPRAPKIKASIPSAPSAPRTAQRQAQLSTPKDTLAEPLVENRDLKNGDVDELASGMTKMSIKLKVPSKEEQKIREAKKAQAAPRGRPKSTITKHAQALITKAEKTSASDAVGNPAEAAQANSKDVRSSQGAPNDIISPSAPNVAAILPNDSGAQIVSPAPPNLGPPSFSPDSAPAIAATAPIAGASNMPPQTTFERPSAPLPQPADVFSDLPSPPTPLQEPMMAPATPKHTKGDLPVFTPRSPIVFGMPSTPHQSIEQNLAAHSAPGNPVVERLESKPSHDNVVEDQILALGKKAISGPPQLQHPSTAEGILSQREQSHDIFDVPETPHHDKTGGI